MSYSSTAGVDEAKPVGSTTPLASVDEVIRDLKVAYNERLDDVLGTTWDTDDPLVVTKLGLILQMAGKQVKAALYNAGSLGATPTIDWDNGINQKGVLSANCTLAFSNPVEGSWYSLILAQDGTGGRTLTFPASVRWTNNSSAPTLATNANRKTTIFLYYDGSVYLASIGGTGYNVS